MNSKKKKNKCVNCGDYFIREDLIKCDNCGHPVDSPKERWKERNLGKQRGKPKANRDGK